MRKYGMSLFSRRFFEKILVLCMASRDEFELEFSGSSELKLWRFQAELSWAKPSWLDQWLNQWLKGVLGSWNYDLLHKYKWNRKILKNKNFSSFSGNLWFQAEGEKVTSRAKQSQKSFSLSSCSSQLGSDSSLMASIQEGFLIKSELYWRLYSRCCLENNLFCDYTLLLCTKWAWTFIRQMRVFFPHLYVLLGLILYKGLTKR